MHTHTTKLRTTLASPNLYIHKSLLGIQPNTHQHTPPATPELHTHTPPRTLTDTQCSMSSAHTPQMPHINLSKEHAHWEMPGPCFLPPPTLEQRLPSGFLGSKHWGPGELWRSGSSSSLWPHYRGPAYQALVPPASFIPIPWMHI